MHKPFRYAAWLLAFTMLLPDSSAHGAQTCDTAVTATSPDSRLNNRAKDGTLTDTATGLMWKMCSEGQTYNADTNTCSGASATYTWKQALQRARAVNQGAAGQGLGHTDWRVPNIKELRSLVEQACQDPAINASAFPLTPSSPGLYWSSSPSRKTLGDAWGTDFTFGSADLAPMASPAYLRLVRGGL